MKYHTDLSSNVCPNSLLITDIYKCVKAMCVKSVNATKFRRIYTTFNDKRQGSKSFYQNNKYQKSTLLQ